MLVAGDDALRREQLRLAEAVGAGVLAVGVAGLKMSQLEDLSARNEDSVPVPGLVAVAAKT